MWLLRSRFARRALAAAASIVALALILIAAAHLPAVRTRVLALVREQVSNDFGIIVDAKALHYNLLAVSIELESPRLSAGGERPFFEAEAVRAVLDRRVLRGVFELERLEIEQGHVTVLRRRDGTTNLPASRAGPASEPSPIHLGLVELRSVSVDIDDETAGYRFKTTPIDLSLDARAGAPSGAFGPAAITFQSGLTESKSPAPSLSATVSGRIGFDGSRLSVQDIRIDAPEGRLALAGWIDVVSETVRVDVRAQLEADLARAGRLVPVAQGFVGSVTADVQVRGAIGEPTVRATIGGKGLRVRSTPEMSLAADATYADGRVDIERFAVASDIGTVEASGTLDLPLTDRAPGTSRLLGQVSRADVDRLLAAAGIRSPVRVGTTASGRVEVVLQNGSPLEPDSWLQSDVDGVIELAGVGGGLSAGGRLDLAMRGGRWSVPHTVMSPVGATTLAGTVSGEMRQVAGSLVHTLSGSTRLQMERVRELVPVLQEAGVNVPAPFDQVEGALDVRLAPTGRLDNPAVNAAIAGRGIRLPGVSGEGELEAEVSVDARGLRASSLEIRLGRTHANASGEYTWTGNINSRFAAAADDIEALAAAFDFADAALAGSATIAGSLQGSVDLPAGQAELTAQDLSAYGASIGPLAARLDIRDERLTIDASAPQLEARLNGTLNVREPFEFRTDVAFERTPLSVLPTATQTSQMQVEGAITGIARIRGNLQRLADVSGEAELRALDVTAAGVPISLDAPTTVSFDPSAITATPTRVRVGRETELRLQGALGTKAARDGIDLHMQGTLTDLLALAAAALPDVAVASEGSRFEIDLHAGGTLTAPQPSGRVRLDAAAIRYRDLPPLTGLALAARVEPAQIALQSLTAEWQGARVSAEGALPFRTLLAAPISGGGNTWLANWLASLPYEPRSATLTARATGITAEALAPFVDPAQRDKIGGTADVTVRAAADRFALDAVRASAVIDRASLDLAGVPLTQSAPTRVILEGGRVRLDEFRWNAQGNELRATGGADLTGAVPSVDVAVDGAVDLRMLGAFASGFASAGLAHTALTVKGPLSSPAVLGTIDVMAGELRLDVPSVAASDFEGTIAVDATRKATVSLKGFVNGGPAALEGSLALDDLASPTGRITLSARNVMLEYPEGFQTESNVDLVLALEPSAPTLSGRIDVLSGVYREPIVVSRSLLSGLGRVDVSSAGSGSPFAASLRLDIAVATTDQIRIDNNYGRLNLSASLSVTGSADRPGVIGRIEAEPDGEVYLAGNTYRIQTFVVDLTNPRTVSPEVTFLAETRVGDVPIEIALQCAATGPCEREVRSQAAGITNERAEELLFGISSDPNAAGAQLARLLSGELLGIVGGTVGLDTLRLEQAAGERTDLFDDPTLVAGDVNPASRLTVGKRLGDRVELAYSQNLAESGFVMSTSYFAPAGISLRALLLDNQNRSYEFRHEPRIGAPRRARPAPRAAATIDAVRFSGNPGVAEAELRRQLRLTEDDRFEFAAWQADRERLNRFYFDRGFFEARVRARRTVSGQGQPETIALEYAVEQGRPTRLEVSGFDLPPETRRRIADRWAAAVFDAFLERDATLIAREHLYQQGHLGARVDAKIADDADGVRTLRVEIVPGPVTTPRLEIAGNAAIPTPRLLEAARNAGPLAGWLNPAALALAMERLYSEEGFLSAEAEVRSPEFQDGGSIVRVTIREGERWQLGRVTLGGAEALGRSASLSDPGLAPGNRYDPRAIGEGLAALEQRFRDEGFLDVRVVSETVLDRPARRADLHVLVAPGPRTILAAIAVDGVPPDNRTVAQSLDIAAGMPIGASALAAAKRALYDTGRYRSVEIALEPVDGATSGDAAVSGDRRAVVRIRVAERPRYSFRYGLSVNSDVIAPDERDTRLGFAADLENRNLFGRGMTVGLSARLRRDQEVGRVYLSANRFFGLPLRSNVFLSRGRQDIGSGTEVKTVSDVTEVSAEQVYGQRRLMELRYGYGLGRNRTTRTTLTGSDFDLTVRVARVTTSGLVDRRNDPFDPVRGWFTSSSLELSEPGIGSELSFLKSFTQLYHFTPLGGGLVLAAAGRLGLARTFKDETLIPSERFFAGGATSVRGYRENDLGPRSIFGDADGGAALLVANGELRFPIYKWARGVGFADLGNVYPTVGDILNTQLLMGAGAGLRLNTPVGLLRLDLAFPVNPRPFDPSWRLHFGLGHAF